MFPIVKPYFAPIPTYPGGNWCWAFCSKDVDPLETVNILQAAEIEKETQYYNRDIHRAAFAVPNFMKKLIEKE